ncbi:glycosaminoglycan xylosylkinase-like [Asterias amurensis]|uniref:glycosaminoglycan xylosylkinase-like n=1 Tax=Asterias amurensis TaxID=7602 RepID=UPI003AB2BA88
MRFQNRLILLFCAVLFLTSVSVIHILLAKDDHQRNARQRARLSIPSGIQQIHGHPGKRRQNDAKFTVILEGGESQILRTPLRRNRPTHEKKKSPGNETLPRRDVPVRMKLRVGWDVQEMQGTGHPWQQFHSDIHQDALYSEDAPYMASLLNDLATVKIVNVSLFDGGSQAKLDVRLADGNRAIVKPMRASREFVYKYNKKEPFWLDQERHNAEIAAFHLDKILGFRRVCPCAGRLINLTQELLLNCKDQELLKTVFRKDGNICFIGKCAPWFCNEEHPICAKGDMMEISLCQFLPSFDGGFPIFQREYPWSQGVKESKVWKGKNICQDFLEQPVWMNGRYFLDLIEQGMFDFFIRNYDRHHFDMLYKYKRNGFIVFLDNGKGFGNPHEDDITFLAPVYQCCKVRRSTYLHFQTLTQPESRLSDLLRTSMSHDPLAPVVTEHHLRAMDRRLATVLQTIDKCIQTKGRDYVLVERTDM